MSFFPIHPSWSGQRFRSQLRRWLTYLVLVSFTAGLVIGCSAPTPTSGEADPSASVPGRLRVAMIATGAADDGSWSEAGYNGLQLIAQEFNAEVEFTGEVADTDGERYLREYAEAGYDFIIGHSGGYIDGAEIVAAEFPRTKFALVTTYPGNNQNLGAVAFRSGEVGYLSGVLAAMTTETNKVAYLVGYDYPVYQEEAALFRKGALATNPDVEVVTEFLQTWTDGEKGQAVALDLAAQGFDRFAINADEAGIEAIHALDEQYDNAKMIGWTTDQHELAPEHILTSMMQDIPHLVLNAADLLQQGKWEGKLYKFGLKEDIYSVAPFRGALTPAQEAEFETVKAQVMTGEIDISPDSV